MVAQAQPADLPTPRQQARQDLQKMGFDMGVRELAPPPVETESRTLSPDGKMAASFSSDGKLTLWDALTGQDVRTIQAYDSTPRLDSNETVAFSPDGKWLFTLGKIKQIVGPGEVGQIGTYGRGGATTETTQGKIWNLATGALVWTLPEMRDGLEWNTAVKTFAISPDSQILATKAAYGPIHLWDIKTGKLLRTLPVPIITLDALAFSPDGKTLAGGGTHYRSFNTEIFLWDVPSGELQRSFKQPDNLNGMQILDIAFSPDGKLIAIGGGVGRFEITSPGAGTFNVQSGVAQLWDVKSGVMMRGMGLPVHRNSITKLVFSPDGTRLATGSRDQTVGLWEVRMSRQLGVATRYGTETKVETTETKAGKPGIQRVETEDDEFGQTSKRARDFPLADPNAPGTVTIKRSKTTLSGVGVQDLIFSRDGKTLDILSRDKVVRAWDVSPPTPLSDPLRRIIPSNDFNSSSLLWTADSRSLISGVGDKKVRFWTASDLQEAPFFRADDEEITEIAVAPSAPDAPQFHEMAPLLATGSNRMKWQKKSENSASGSVTGFEVKLWNAETHELKQKMKFDGFALTALAVSPGGQWVAAAGGLLGPVPEGVIREGNGVALAVGGPEDAGNPADMTQKNSGIVLLWDAETGELKQKFAVTDEMPTALAFSPDSSLLASDGNEAGVMLWKTATGAALPTLDEDRPPPLKPGEHRYSVRFGTPRGKPTLAFTQDGTQLARSRKGAVKLWNLETGALARTLAGPENLSKFDTVLFALTPDGKMLATVGQQQPLTLWDIATGKALWKSPERVAISQMGISQMAMAPNGRTLATGEGNEIRLRDITQASKGIVN